MTYPLRSEFRACNFQLTIAFRYPSIGGARQLSFGNGGSLDQDGARMYKRPFCLGANLSSNAYIRYLHADPRTRGPADRWIPECISRPTVEERRSGSFPAK